jgi:hypothetical protein
MISILDLFVQRIIFHEEKKKTQIYQILKGK